MSHLPSKSLVNPRLLPLFNTSLTSQSHSISTSDHLKRNQSTPTDLLSHLQSCTNPSSLPQAHQIHAQIIIYNLHNTHNIANTILSTYILCNSLQNAVTAFFAVQSLRFSPSSWNWLIRGFTNNGHNKHAILYYLKMLTCGVRPDKYTFPSVVKACGSLRMGKLVHDNICLLGLESDVFVGSALVKMYAQNDCVRDARNVFDKIHGKDSVLWNVMVNGYAKTGDEEEALGMFCDMRVSDVEPNYVTFACVLSVCAAKGLAGFGVQVHGLVVRLGFEFDSRVANTLLAMYSKCRCLDEARRLFSVMPQTDLVTWNGMISGYVQNGLMDEARGLFRELLGSGVKPDSITFASFLPSISDFSCLVQAKEIHGYIVRNGVCLDAFLKSALIDIYFKCGGIDIAFKLFNQTDTIDVVICTAMISGYIVNGMSSEALTIFRMIVRGRMRPSSVTLATVLPACASLVNLMWGKELHCHILKNGHREKCYVESALTDMYAKCGKLDLSYRVFGGMCEKDSVAWNSMISSCSQNGKPGEAINLFRQMGLQGTSYDYVTISAALSACANLPALHHGREIHGFLIKDNLRSDLFAESALIDMYAKCGDLVIARRVFDSMRQKNEVSWNSMIAAYGAHGRVRDAVKLFHEMLETGIQPDHVTFLAIISACGHVGLVDEGAQYLQSMTEDYGILPRMEHYACIVDLYGRVGRLDKALNVISNIPFPIDAGIWGALLGACKVHGNVEVAEIAAKHLFELDPENSGYYILLANVHANAGQWDGVNKVRRLMKERGVQKLPGCSWIEINSITHMFVAEDKCHPLSFEIYQLLKNLLLEIRKEGYVPEPYLPVHSIAGPV